MLAAPGNNHPGSRLPRPRPRRQRRQPPAVRPAAGLGGQPIAGGQPARQPGVQTSSEVAARSGPWRCSHCLRSPTIAPHWPPRWASRGGASNATPAASGGGELVKALAQHAQPKVDVGGADVERRARP